MNTRAEEKLRMVFPAAEVARRIAAVGEEINRVYSEGNLVMICVLKGAFMFFSDLVKHVTVRPELDFIRVASYDYGIESSRNVRLTKDVELALQGKHVLLVEDVVDSGHSMLFLQKLLRSRNLASLRIAALVDKRECREVDVWVDFAGFVLPNGFIVGYGLDYAEQFRELPAIYEVLFADVGKGRSGS
jgi:hypoxanthine phosphoribosyltransferase